MKGIEYSLGFVFEALAFNSWNRNKLQIVASKFHLFIMVSHSSFSGYLRVTKRVYQAWPILYLSHLQHSVALTQRASRCSLILVHRLQEKTVSFLLGFEAGTASSRSQAVCLQWERMRPMSKEKHEIKRWIR